MQRGERSVRPIMEAGLGVLVEDDQPLTESIAIEPAYGHTAGHSMLHLVSAAQHAYFTGDVFQHPLQLPYPELFMPGDDDRALGIETRKRVLAVCIQHRALMLPAHFPRPYAGYARSKSGRTLFEPLTM